MHRTATCGQGGCRSSMRVFEMLKNGRLHEPCFHLRILSRSPCYANESSYQALDQSMQYTSSIAKRSRKNMCNRPYLTRY